jgi:hypothetical protein
MTGPRLAIIVGAAVAVLAVAGNLTRRGLPDFFADWIVLAVGAIAVGLAASLIFAWLRTRWLIRKA